MNYELYTDGATRPTNPGPSGYGAALYVEGDLFESTSGFLGAPFSNNQAEYAGMFAGLLMASTYTFPVGATLTVKSDSTLVLNQVTGRWALRAQKLGPLLAAVRRVAADLDKKGVHVWYEHVKGHDGIEGNVLVDSLAGRAVIEQSPEPPLSVKNIFDQSQDKGSIIQKGHEKLAELVKEHFNSQYTVLDVGIQIPVSQRTQIYLQHGVTGQLLLHFPQLALINANHTKLVVLATGFKRVAGTSLALLTMDESAFHTAKELGRMGTDVMLVHRPHARDKWMTDKELGFGVVDRATPMRHISVRHLTAGRRFTRDGWPPFVELVGGVWTVLLDG